MVSRKGSLEGKVAIVTGGGTGIGKGIALALAREGASIAVAARRAGPIEQTAKEVSDLGGRGLAIPTDVTDSQQVNRLVERTIAEMGRIDILVNNAGLVRGERLKPIWDITDEEWRLGIDTNLSGTFFGCRAVGKHFVAQRSGKVINVASIIGLKGMGNNFMYCCAKGGVVQLTRSLALTWVQNNIQVNCIAPGTIDVSTWQPEQRGTPGDRPEFIPVGRLGIPTDLGSMALFLASDASDYVTGAVFTVDGGSLAGGRAPTGYAPTITIKED